MQQLVDRLNSTTDEMEALQESFGRTLGLKEIELRSAKDQVCSFKVGMGQFECLCARADFCGKHGNNKKHCATWFHTGQRTEGKVSRSTAGSRRKACFPFTNDSQWRGESVADRLRREEEKTKWKQSGRLTSTPSPCLFIRPCTWTRLTHTRPSVSYDSRALVLKIC